jgi:hypothetical protein
MSEEVKKKKRSTTKQEENPHPRPRMGFFVNLGNQEPHGLPPRSSRNLIFSIKQNG